MDSWFHEHSLLGIWCGMASLIVSLDLQTSFFANPFTSICIFSESFCTKCLIFLPSFSSWLITGSLVQLGHAFFMDGETLSAYIGKLCRSAVLLVFKFIQESSIILRTKSLLFCIQLQSYKQGIFLGFDNWLCSMAGYILTSFVFF